MKAVFLLSAGLLLCACAGTPSAPGPATFQPATLDRGTGVEVRVSETGSEAVRVLEVAPDAAWRALPQAYEALGLGGEVMGPQPRVWGNPRVTSRIIGGSRVDVLFRCANEGTGPSSVSRLSIQFSISTVVGETPDGEAQLRTSVTAVGRPLEGTSTGALVCISRGIIEAAIEKEVVARAGGEEHEIRYQPAPALPRMPPSPRATAKGGRPHP